MQGYQPQIAHRQTLGFVEVIETEDIINSTVEKIEWLIKNGAVQNDITILVVTNKDGLALQDACFEQHINAILKSSSSIKTLPKIASLVAMVRYLKEAQQIDAYNFALSCGVESFNIEWFNPFMSSFEVLHQLIKEFNYFEGDKNILKLLEFSLNFNDIDEFLKEFETSNIAIAQNSIHGVNIMTIHGSKGLEFEHVIVMDKLGKSNADRSPFIFEHDENLFIKNIFYRMKNRDSFDKFYKKTIEDKHLLSKKDTLNLLYVALTRASDNMIVIKKDEDSLFDILGMTPSICGELEIKSSHQENFGNHEEIKQFKFQDYGRKKEDKTLKKLTPEISFGNALHHALEMLNNFDIKNLDKVLTLTTQIYQDEVGLKDLEDIKNRVKMLCENELFIQLLKAKKSIKELPITINNEAKQIDLILESEDEIFVIDYKSSLKFQNKHKEQVKHYVKAIEKIMQKPTKGFLIYLLSDRIEMVLV
jgi:exodeoxyribonuclease V beta subunit